MRKMSIRPSDIAWQRCAAEIRDFYALSNKRSHKKDYEAALKHLRIAYALTRRMGEKVL